MRVDLRTAGFAILHTAGLFSADQMSVQSEKADLNQATQLVERFLTEDFNYQADNGDVRYWQSKYSAEHMKRERKLGSTGIQLRSARPVDVDKFFLSTSWKIRKYEVKQNSCKFEIEFINLIIASYNQNSELFEFMVPQQQTEIETIYTIQEKGKWYIDNPLPLHLSADLFRKKLAADIDQQHRILEKENNRVGKPGSTVTQRTILARIQGIRNLESDLERLDKLLAQATRRGGLGQPPAPSR